MKYDTSKTPEENVKLAEKEGDIEGKELLTRETNFVVIIAKQNIEGKEIRLESIPMPFTGPLSREHKIARLGIDPKLIKAETKLLYTDQFLHIENGKIVAINKAPESLKKILQELNDKE
jgi:hypothetical protein